MMNTQYFTDYDIQALLDNELSWEDEKRVREFINRNPPVKKRYEELERQKKLLKAWWSTQKHN